MFFENQFSDFFSRFSASSDSYSLRKMNVVKTLIQVVLFFFRKKPLRTTCAVILIDVFINALRYIWAFCVQLKVICLK